MVATATIGFGLWKQTEYEWQAQYESAKQARYAANYVRNRCVAPAILDKVDCATKARAEQRAYQRDEQDLAAQKVTASWTGLMGMAAIIGVILSAIGVLLIFTTFAETCQSNVIAMRENARNTRRSMATGREAANNLAIAERNALTAMSQVEVARDTAQRQLRAYLSVKIGKLTGWMPGKHASVDFEIVNTGSTPAYNTRIGSAMVFIAHPWEEEWPSLERDRITITSETVVNREQVLQGHVRSPATIPQQLFNRVMSNSTRLYVMGLIIYDDAFDTERETRFCFVLDDGFSKNYIEDMNGGAVPSADIFWHVAPFNNAAT